MSTVYTSVDKTKALALQAKLRAAKKYPCCQCYVTPDKDCPCDDHRRPDGTILKGPHSPGSCALEAVAVVENPKLKGEWVVPVPQEYEKELVAKDRQGLVVKLASDVSLSEPITVVAEAEPIKGEPVVVGDETLETIAVK